MLKDDILKIFIFNLKGKVTEYSYILSGEVSPEGKYVVVLKLYRTNTFILAQNS